jgi:hypothetical protein
MDELNRLLREYLIALTEISFMNETHKIRDLRRDIQDLLIRQKAEEASKESEEASTVEDSESGKHKKKKI